VCVPAATLAPAGSRTTRAAFNTGAVVTSTFAHVTEALVAFDAVHAGETLGDLAMVGRQGC